MNLEKYCKLSMDETEKKFSIYMIGECPPKHFTNDNPFPLFESSLFPDNEQIHISIHYPPYGQKPLDGPHTHDFFELVYVHKGEFVQVIDGTKIVQTRDQLIILRPGAAHAVWVEHETDIVFNILMRKSIIWQTLLHLISPQNPFYRFFFRSVYDTREQQNYLLLQHTEALTEILDRLIMEYFERDTDYEQAMIAQILMLFTECTRICDKGFDRDTDENTVEKILAYIQSNYLTETQQSVAKHFNYSSRQLYRILHNSTGKSYSEIVNACKIENICKWLQNTDISLYDLTEKMGFSDINYFYKVFYREKGIHFSEYKKSLHMKATAN